MKIRWTLFSLATFAALAGSRPAHADTVPGLDYCVRSEIRGNSNTLHFINECSEKAHIMYFLSETDRIKSEWADPGTDDDTLLSVPRGAQVNYYACPDGGNPRTSDGQLIEHPVSEYTCVLP